MISKDKDAMALTGFVFNNELCPNKAQTSLHGIDDNAVHPYHNLLRIQ
jgi:hypothetical protein